jgi:hypothetical protein
MKPEDEEEFMDRLGPEVGLMVGLIGVCAILLLVILGDLYDWFF